MFFKQSTALAQIKGGVVLLSNLAEFPNLDNTPCIFQTGVKTTTRELLTQVILFHNY